MRQATNCRCFLSFSPKISKVAMNKSSMERCLLDLPYELLFEIFRRLPKEKLLDISRLCSIFKEVAGNTRLWKDVYIKYEKEVVDFKELYSEPWPVKVIDMTGTKIEPPHSSKTDQIVKVSELNLSSITANKGTMEAILEKYQCTELYLNDNFVDLQGLFMGIKPEAFSNQTTLEVLSLAFTRCTSRDADSKKVVRIATELWLAPLLSNCENLKSLNMCYNFFNNNDMLGFVRNLPYSLEILSIVHDWPEDSFFKLLAKSTPNLRQLALHWEIIKECPSLLKFKFLEILYTYSFGYRNISDLSMYLIEYLIKFPALKAVYMGHDCDLLLRVPEARLVNHLTTLEPHGIIIGELSTHERSPCPEDGNLWKVSKYQSDVGTS